MKKSFKSRNISVYIVRISAAKEFRDSAPCLDCYRKMKELGVKRIIYSVNDGIIKMNLRDYTPTAMSLGRQFIENGYNTIFRDRKAERQISYNSDNDSYVSDPIDSASVTSSSSDVSNSSHKSRKYKKPRRWKKHRI